MKKIARGKLRLDRETLVALQSSELDAIAGGQAAATALTPSAVGCPISARCTPVVNPIIQKTAEVGRQVGEWGRQLWDRVRPR